MLTPPFLYPLQFPFNPLPLTGPKQLIPALLPDQRYKFEIMQMLFLVTIFRNPGYPNHHLALLTTHRYDQPPPNFKLTNEILGNCRRTCCNQISIVRSVCTPDEDRKSTRLNSSHE